MKELLAQPFIQITVPLIVTFVVATWFQNRRVDEVSKRIDDVNRRLDQIIARLDRIEANQSNHAERIARLEERSGPIVRGRS